MVLFGMVFILFCLVFIIVNVFKYFDEIFNSYWVLEGVVLIFGVFLFMGLWIFVFR